METARRVRDSLDYFTEFLPASTGDLLWDAGGSILQSCKSCGMFRGIET